MTHRSKWWTSHQTQDFRSSLVYISSWGAWYWILLRCVCDFHSKAWSMLSGSLMLPGNPISLLSPSLSSSPCRLYFFLTPNCHQLPSQPHFEVMTFPFYFTKKIEVIRGNFEKPFHYISRFICVCVHEFCPVSCFSRWTIFALSQWSLGPTPSHLIKDSSCPFTRLFLSPYNHILVLLPTLKQITFFWYYTPFQLPVFFFFSFPAQENSLKVMLLYFVLSNFSGNWSELCSFPKFMNGSPNPEWMWLYMEIGSLGGNSG